MPPFPSQSPEQDKLRKQITDYTQYQWLSLMPAWLPGVLNAVNHTKTPPGREGAVAAFHLVMIVIGVACFIWVRIRLSSMKKRLAELELQPASSVPPPIPRP